MQSRVWSGLINDEKGQPNMLPGSPFPDNNQRCGVHCFQSAVNLSGLRYQRCMLQVSSDVSVSKSMKSDDSNETWVTLYIILRLSSADNS